MSHDGVHPVLRQHANHCRPKDNDIFLDQRIKENLFGSIVLLSRLGGVHIVLHLSHSVSVGYTSPRGTGISSTLGVKFSEILVFEGLLHVSLVVGSFLSGFGFTDFLVLGSSKPIGDVRALCDGSKLDLLRLRRTRWMSTTILKETSQRI
jgi:hypothetical protein